MTDFYPLSKEASDLVKGFEAHLVTRAYAGATLRKRIRCMCHSISLWEQLTKRIFNPSEATPDNLNALLQAKKKRGRRDQTLRDDAYALRAFFTWQHESGALT